MDNQIDFVYGTPKALAENKYELPGTGYTFIGWNTDKTAANNGHVEFNDRASINVIHAENNGFVTLYAVWKKGDPTTYKVQHSFMNLDGTTYTVNEAKSEMLSGIIGATTNAAPNQVEGFEAQPINQEIIEDGITVITIHYTRKQYTLTWNFAGGTATDEDCYTTGNVFFEETVIAPVLTKDGHTYVWNETLAETMPATDKTYTAIWTPNSHTVTIINAGTGGTTTDTYNYGSTVTLDPGTKSG